jgi:hypothetical protein
MTLNASGPISLGGSTSGQSVNLEIGAAATAQVSFNDANVRTLTGTSAGTQLSMPTDFWGKSFGATVNFVDTTVYAFNTGANATAGYRINPSGLDYQSLNGGAYSSLNQWVTPTSASNNYEVFATVSSGSLSSGTTGSWVATSTNPAWTRTRTSIGTDIVVLSMQVRAVGSGTVLDTWTVTLEAERG